MRSDLPVAAARRAVIDSTVVADSTGQPSSWVGGARRWDAYNLTILVITLLIIVAEGPPQFRDRLLAAAALLAMAAWYVLLGRSVLYGGGAGAETGRRGALYLAGLIGLLAIAEILSGTDTFILLALCPQCFMAVSFRSAVAAVVALNGTPVLIALAQHETAARVGTAAGIAALGVAFSVAFGSWVSDIIDRSEERAALIEQLEATRAELGRAQHAAGTLAERQRLAAEIHDTIAQGFSSIVMLVQAAGWWPAWPRPAWTAAASMTRCAGWPRRRRPSWASRQTCRSAARAGNWPPGRRWCCCGSARRRCPTSASTRRRTGRRSC
jgi:hypothetical protein